MLTWEITFNDDTYGYVDAPNVLSAAQKILSQNWNHDIQEVERIKLVDNGFGPDVRGGWFSGNRRRR